MIKLTIEIIKEAVYEYFKPVLWLFRRWQLFWQKRKTKKMFGPKMGTWSVHSEIDPRWNKSGRGYGLVTSGGPIKMQKWIKKCIKKFGEPPSDVTEGFWKD